MTTPTLDAKAQGFTLLELIIVLALMVIGAAVMIPNITSSANAQFNAEIRKANAVLRYARRLAIVDAAPQTVRLYALDRSAGDFDQRLAERLAQRRDIDWISDNITLAYQPELNQPSKPQPTIELTFFPQGGSTGGVLTFEQNDRHAQLRIDPLTGRIAAAYNGEELDEEALDAAF
jgi:type II secretion system protein H